jgi:hypothetical protein
MDFSLSADETRQVELHLKSCRQCAELLEEMRSASALCQNFPTLELEPDFLEKILLRTSGRPRTRSFSERIHKYFLRPLLTPRFAAGAVLATLFLALSVHFMMPTLSNAVSFLSPPKMLRVLDRGAQTLYSEGLKVYNKKNELQDQFIFLKNDTLNKMRFFMEKMQVPVEGKKEEKESIREDNRSPEEKRSQMWLWKA